MLTQEMGAYKLSKPQVKWKINTCQTNNQTKYNNRSGLHSPTTDHDDQELDDMYDGKLLVE